MKNSLYAFVIRVMGDGAVVLVQTAVPLLALSFGASPVLLGAIGWAAMLIRLPFCMMAGTLSDRLGRKAVIVPAALLFLLAAIGILRSQSNLALLVFYALFMIGNGTFHPPIQSLIGDLSKPGQLTRNLVVFNLGWCGGIAITFFAMGWLVSIGLRAPVYVAAAFLVVAIALLLSWRTQGADDPGADADTPPPPEAHPRVLLASRIGHFLGFTGFATIVILFPKLGKDLGWSDQAIAETIAYLRAGIALALVATTVGPWWRGRFWLQPVGQAAMLLFAMVMAITSRKAVFALAFLGVGAALGIAYTSAMYHGLSARRKRGRNSGIHEALVSAASITGCLFGGILAQLFTTRAPFVLFGVLVGLGLVATAVVRCTVADPAEPVTEPRADAGR